MACWLGASYDFYSSVLYGYEGIKIVSHLDIIDISDYVVCRQYVFSDLLCSISQVIISSETVF